MNRMSENPSNPSEIAEQAAVINPRLRPVIYAATSVLLIFTQGLGMNFVPVNLPQLAGAFGATTTEMNWFVAAYMAPFASMTLILIKVRTQFGLRRFAEPSIVVFVVASLLHLIPHNIYSGMAVRFLAGMVGPAISSLGFLYMLEAFPPALKRTWGFSMALTCSLSMPMVARLISPPLLDIGGWQALYAMDVGLALLALAAIYRLPLTTIQRAKVLHWKDAITFPLIAIGFGLLAVVFTMGRQPDYWWLESPWLGWCAAAALVAIGAAAVIEVHRDTPLVNVRWLLSGEMLRFALVALVFRIVLSEQTTGAAGLFQSIGLLNEQSRGLYLVILAGMAAGGLVSGAILKPERIRRIHMLSLLCICAGACMDGQATSLTRPENMYMSQALIAFGSVLFLPSVMTAGIAAALKRGPTYITSYIVVFLFTQNLGGLMGSSFLNTFVTIREKFHSSLLVERIVMADPLVAGRVSQLSAAYGRVLTDGVLLKAEGLALLSQQTTREAYILAYNDVFLAISVIAGAALAVLLLRSAYIQLKMKFFLPTNKTGEPVSC
ncbi:MFS transporter [Termitidicoccus mucosus]